jgi:hypothetical protein
MAGLQIENQVSDYRLLGASSFSKEGCFISVCEILAIFVSSAFIFWPVFILNAFYFMLFKYLNF